MRQRFVEVDVTGGGARSRLEAMTVLTCFAALPRQHPRAADPHPQ